MTDAITTHKKKKRFISLPSLPVGPKTKRVTPTATVVTPVKTGDAVDEAIDTPPRVARTRSSRSHSTSVPPPQQSQQRQDSTPTPMVVIRNRSSSQASLTRPRLENVFDAPESPVERTQTCRAARKQDDTVVKYSWMPLTATVAAARDDDDDDILREMAAMEEARQRYAVEHLHRELQSHLTMTMPVLPPEPLVPVQPSESSEEAAPPPLSLIPVFASFVHYKNGLLNRRIDSADIPESLCFVCMHESDTVVPIKSLTGVLDLAEAGPIRPLYRELNICETCDGARDATQPYTAFDEAALVFFMPLFI